MGANGDVRIAVIGLNSRGQEHIHGFRRLPGVRVTALCDCDGAVLDREVAAFTKNGGSVAAFTDIRKLFDAGVCDAIAVATPNHWHAALGGMACERGLHAYVEKPLTHQFWEGPRLMALAERHGTVVACGTQSRSNPGMQQAIAFAQSGQLGKIVLARGLCYKRRRSIGKVAAPKAPPASVDYDLWLGPAAEQPVQRTQFHYDWHWQWPFGNGDLGNQGVHQMDMCRWALQCELPARVWSLGGRFGYDDDGQTPNTQIVWLDYPGAPIVFEVRGLPAAPGDDAMDRFLGARVGVVLHCEGGVVVMPDYEGGVARDLAGREIATFGGGGDHFANFIAAVRAGDSRLLASDARQGHLSAALCHLGNASFRAGQAVDRAAARARVAAMPAVSEAWERMATHLGANQVDLDDGRLQLGNMLEIGDGSGLPAVAHRAPFALPELPA
ncbi:MAG: Gfo/Idh/MocA family oxidoreductase [Planctomycetes bacterium]|nr:Gfo/Idh/MocA family oxidoreductase [Planctomycetota bacterium]